MSVCAAGSHLTKDVKMHGQTVTFVVDTGSPVTLLPLDVWGGDPEFLCPTDVKLHSYSGNKLSVLGIADVKIEGCTKPVKVYIVQKGVPLMGLDLMELLRVNVVDGQVCAVTPPVPGSSSDQSAPTGGAPSPTGAGLRNQPQVPQPCIKGYMHQVTVDPSVCPVQQPLRRLPFAIRDEFAAKLSEMEAAGIIERVDASPWVSPVVVGRKKSGDIRFLLDLRRVNQAVVTDGYPIPHMDDVLHSLQGSSVYTVLDLKDAYHQVELHPDSRNLTAFLTHAGLFRMTRIPQGLCSSGPCFQRIMMDMLQGVPGVTVYLDDVVVHGSSRKEHDQSLAQVEAIFKAHNVQVNETKCLRARTEIPFLGLRISAGQLAVDPERVRPLLNMPDPTSQKELKSLLGALGYYSRFIEHFSDKTAILRDALLAEHFEWTTVLSQALRSVMSEISASKGLAFFNPSLRTIVTSDASDIGCGAILSQVTASGMEEVVAYTSKKFTPAELRYSVVEKEALGCVYAVEKWRPFLWGRKFLLRTDNQALTSVFGLKGSTRVGRRIARWEARLLAFNFDVQHVRSQDNAVADGLSRLPVVDSWEDDDSVEIAALGLQTELSAVTEDELCAAAASDQVLSQVRDSVLSGRWNRRDPHMSPYFQVRHELSVSGSLVFRGDQLVAPADLQRRLLDVAHECHPGAVRTKQRLRACYWWPGMDRQVETLIRNCALCNTHSKSATVSRPPVQQVDLPAGPWTRLVLDAIGPMPGPVSERYGLVLVDAYSRWPEVALMHEVTSATVISFLDAVFSREGVCSELLTDNGSVFTSHEFNRYCQVHGIKLIHSSPYSPQTCGLVERHNRHVKDSLETARLLGEERTCFLRRSLQVYRATVHPATGVTPFKAMRGRDMRTKLTVPDPCSVQPDTIAAGVKEHHARYQDKYLTRCNRSTGPLPTWQPGDWVRVRVPFGKKRQYGPPLQISSQKGPVSYRLSDGQRVHARRLSPVHGQCLHRFDPELEAEHRPWVPPVGSDVETPAEHNPVLAPGVQRPVPERLPHSPRRGARLRYAPERYSPEP